MPEAAVSSEEQRARSALAAMGIGGVGLRLQRAALPVLVPMHRAVESECWIADAGESETVFLKLLCEDMRPFVDAAAALEASLAAAALGVAPVVKGHDAGSGAIALEFLGEGWRTADMASLQDPGIRASAIAAQRRFQDGPALGRCRTIFELLRDYAAMRARLQPPLPGAIGDLEDHVSRIESGFAAAGFDIRPCHGDSVASNIMLGPGGTVRLVDFDWAAGGDPHHDLAALLIDIEPWDEGVRAAVEMWEGRFDRCVYHRVKLHMILDDFRWASFALLAAHISGRRHVEFFKYGAFKILRCRYHLRVWPVEEMLRKI